MRQVFTLILVAMAVSANVSAADHIIFRNGTESDVKLFQINDDKIIFSYIGDNSGLRNEIQTKDAFMVSIEKQGNIYITTEGKRISGEQKRVNPFKNDVIYLAKGAEIAANNIRTDENSITFNTVTKNRFGFISKSESGVVSIPKESVFIIRYKSGVIDIITPFDDKTEQEKIPETAEQETPTQPQFIVVFHEVKRGETLQKIADSYNVSPNQIIEWNDLEIKGKSLPRLKTGMQLMIYQPK